MDSVLYSDSFGSVNCVWSFIGGDRSYISTAVTDHLYGTDRLNYFLNIKLVEPAKLEGTSCRKFTVTNGSVMNEVSTPFFLPGEVIEIRCNIGYGMKKNKTYLQQYQITCTKDFVVPINPICLKIETESRSKPEDNNKNGDDSHKFYIAVLILETTIAGCLVAAFAAILRNYQKKLAWYRKKLAWYRKKLVWYKNNSHDSNGPDAAELSNVIISNNNNDNNDDDNNDDDSSM